MTNRQEAEVVLSAWRDVERRLQQAPAGSAESEELQAEAFRLRDEYLAIVAEAARGHNDDPPVGWWMEVGYPI
jgi:hypothetical protein